MDIQKLVKQISKKLGPPKQRAAFGTWSAYAWAVRGLTDQGYGISDAVRQVLISTGNADNPKAFGSLRAALYKIKDAEWPADLSNEAAKKTETGEVGFE